MSLPRRVVPCTTHLITRRCLDRRFYLRPCPEVNAVFEYALASAANKHGMLVHSVGVQSNHAHDVVTDVRGVMPDFTRDYHRETAMALKELFGIPETVWSDAPTSQVELVTEAAQVEAVLYTIMNPVAAGLVFRAAEWPGLVALPGCREIVAKRPKHWFGSGRPETVQLSIVPPPAWTGGVAAWHVRLAELVGEREEVLARERRREGRAVMGRERVLHQHPFERPKTGDRLEPKRNPVLAAGGDVGALKAAIAALRAWRTGYRESWVGWCVDKSTAFPVGSWWVVQRAGAAVVG